VSTELEVRLLDGMRDVDESAWNRLLAPDSSPFLEWAWLEALEQTGCVGAERGWLPRHVAVYRGSELVAAAPAYAKGNSEGEFIFDHQWAAVATRHFRLRWYPKLILAVPFTPATGDRVLVAPGLDRDVVRAAVADVVPRVVDELELSSAHRLFPRQDEQEVFASRGWLARYGIQYHWSNHGFRNPEGAACGPRCRHRRRDPSGRCDR
jgi:uncharacterized protein